MTRMNSSSLACALALSFVSAAAAAGNADWQRYVVPQSGAAVEIPMAIFSEDAGLPESGVGRRFYSNDRRADMTVQSFPNPAHDSPAAFLEKQRPPANLVYKKVTPNFFVASSFRNGRIFYDRCNRAGEYMNCVLLNYPAAEKQQWDEVVTRISYSLTN
jgi:hypothetical protein